MGAYMIDNELLLTLLDNLQDGVCIYNERGDFIYVNSAVVKVRGISRQRYLSMNVHDLYQSKYIDICVFDMVCAQKKTVTAIQRYQITGKPDKVKMVTGFPIFDNMGRVHNVVTILRDIQAYEELYRKTLADNLVMPETLMGEAAGSAPIIAESPKMKSLLSVAQNVAALDSNVVLYGESGTGKEVLAHYVHDHSVRRRKPMVVVNCAAFPESLLDAELFGYEKGSFTGALNTGKVGLVETADGGTLFLDEINSFPYSLQSKLLRLIETKSFKPIGSVKTKKVDFRLIAATNSDLEAMVRAGTFRADLYYRLNVVPLYLPPLRERKEDVIPLCNYFIQYFSERYSLDKRLSKRVYSAAYRYDWPGNVRELRNFIERVMVMTPANVTTINDLPVGMLGSMEQQDGPVIPGTRQELDREAIQEALRICDGYRERTAQYLGISRRTLQYKMKEFNIVYERK